VITGSAQSLQTLSTSNGSWSGTTPLSYRYQWQICDSTGAGCQNIVNATDATYTVTSSEIGRRLGAIVTATNAAGVSSAASALTDPAAYRTASGVTLQAIDGGPTYFASKSPQSAWMDEHILLGAWAEQPQNLTEVEFATAMGDNIYWSLAGSATDPTNKRADYDVIRQGGMHVSAPDVTAQSGSETVAYDGTDEADMNLGPGVGGWDTTGYSQNNCLPPAASCGYTVANFFYTGRPASYGSPGYPINGAAIHQGFGKGVLFWEAAQPAAAFLNYSDILSADSYWLTDNDLKMPSQGGCALLPDDRTACGGGNGTGLTAAQSQLPANYEYNVTDLDALQAINGESKPILVDVETGCPFSDGDSAGNCATPPQSVAAAWHALIAGARGIIWFQHNFSGPCQDNRTFIDGSDPWGDNYDCEQTPGVALHDVVGAVSGFNHEVAELNDVLLSPTARGEVSTTADVSAMAKSYQSNTSCYVFAGSGRPATPPPADQSATFTLADDYTGPVTVYDENRTVAASNGVFQDNFADANAVHTYVIPSPC
jgi:hypothetical protein